MADGMENLKLTVNEDFAKKLHKQKERAELDQCKYCKAFRKGLKEKFTRARSYWGKSCTCFTKLTYMQGFSPVLNDVFCVASSKTEIWWQGPWQWIRFKLLRIWRWRCTGEFDVCLMFSLHIRVAFTVACKHSSGYPVTSFHGHLVPNHFVPSKE